MPASHRQDVGVAGQVRAHLDVPTLSGLEPAVEEDSVQLGYRRPWIMFLM